MGSLIIPGGRRPLGRKPHLRKGNKKRRGPEEWLGREAVTLHFPSESGLDSWPVPQPHRSSVVMVWLRGAAVVLYVRTCDVVASAAAVRAAAVRAGAAASSTAAFDVP